MTEDMLALAGVFTTAIVLGLGIPLIRIWGRRKDREAALTPPDHGQEARLERIEHAIGAIAVEVERISEGQRFVTKLLAERAPAAALPPAPPRA